MSKRDFRIVNMTAGQKAESQKVFKRIGETSYRNLGVLSRIALFDSNKALITSGLRVVPVSGMTVRVGLGKGLQLESSSSDLLPFLNISNTDITIDAANGFDRTDIIEAQVAEVTDKDDYSETIVDPVTGIITLQAVKRDIRYYLNIRKKYDNTASTAGAAGIYTGTVSIPGTIDLSVNYLIRVSAGENGSLQEIDLRGASPEATTKAEICANINAAVGYTMASISGNYIVISGEGTGTASCFEFQPPVTAPDLDALQIVLGLPATGAYVYPYAGTNEWFKLAEIDVGPSTTVITTGLIRNIDQKSTWASEAATIMCQPPLYNPDGVMIPNLNAEFLGGETIENIRIRTSGALLELACNVFQIRTSAADHTWTSVCYGNGLFVAVASSGTTNRVATSPDGVNWVTRTSAADNGWSSVCYGNGLFVAVAHSGTGNRVMTSSNGIDWTIRTSAADNEWYSVCYGNGLFVAVSITGTGNRVMTSSNGIDWTIQTSAADRGWYSVCYGNGLFVAVAYDGTGNRVMTSPNGIDWTIRASAYDALSWHSVCYGNGLFVSVSTTGVGNRVMTSSNGIDWTIRTSAADNYWHSVCYSNGLFVAVAYSGTGNRVMTSSNGIDWVTRTSAADNYWLSVCYGNGLFVAIASTGTGNRVMTSIKITPIF